MKAGSIGLLLQPLKNAGGFQDRQELATNVAFKFVDAIGNNNKVVISPKNWLEGEKS